LPKAVALFDAALSSGELALLDKRSQFLRNRGVALIDLGRLDEAEKSLKDSIDANKSDTLGIERANHELGYIQRLRNGGTPTGIVLKNRLETPSTKDEPPASQPHFAASRHFPLARRWRVRGQTRSAALPLLGFWGLVHGPHPFPEKLNRGRSAPAAPSSDAARRLASAITLRGMARTTAKPPRRHAGAFRRNGST
jgi:hypothetical protein